MKILYVTTDPLENNTSANLRNRGIILGLIEAGNIIDTLSLEIDDKSYNYDDSNSKVISQINNRYFIKKNMLYKLFQSNKESSISTYDHDKKIKLKQNTIKTTVKKLANKFYIYDFQKMNFLFTNFSKIDLAKYDLIISSSDPKSSHLIIKKMHKIISYGVWFQYWGDPMLEDITSTNGRIKKFRLKKEEEKLLKLADRIYYTSPFTMARQKSLYPQYASNMDYILQTCEEREMKNIKKEDKGISLAYVGNYNEQVRNIMPLCNAVKEMNVNLIIVGEGDKKINQNNITILEKVKYSRAQEIEEKSDIIICLCNKRGTQIPGKIYYVASHNKPVIIILDGEYSDELYSFFIQFKRYIICKNNKNEIIEAISKAKIELEEKHKYVIPKEMKPSYAAKIIMSVNGKDG